MINEHTAKLFCKEDISHIENYDKAVADTTQTWDIHHKLEIHSDYTNSMHYMKLMHLYYKRPAKELILLTHADHMKLHNAGKHNPIYGKQHSEETKRKMSESAQLRWRKKWQNKIRLT